MSFKDLQPEDQELVLECITFVANGSQIEDGEFHTRLGIERKTLDKIISTWPEINDSSEDSDQFLAINNCLNEVCHGISIPQEEWARSFSQPRERVKQAFSNWLRSRGATHESIR
jgi:hypothetical protein